MRFTPTSALVLLALAFAGPAPAAEPGVTSFTLPNGLVGVVVEDRRAPVVTQTIWYRVGSADDPPGRSGIAHFLEHLMFKGTPTFEEGAFSRIVTENGGSDNAFTSTDHTAYFQRIASDRLELVMEMEADRMTNVDPSEAAVAAERDVVLEERRQVVENSPDAVFGEQTTAALYLNHPYGRPIIGWEHEIEAFTRDAALEFYRIHYAPNNAVLVIAGDVDPAAVEALAVEHFGPIPAAPDLPDRVRPQEPPHRAARRIEMRDARVAEPSLTRLHLAPQRRSGDQREAAALALLAAALGGSGVTSTLAQALVYRDGVALDAGAFYSSTGLDPQSFGLYVTPKPDVTLAEAEAAMDAVIARFLDEGPDPEQLARIKNSLRAREIYARDDQGDRARRIGAALTTGLTLEDVEEWPRLLQEVTAEEIRAAAEAVLRPENSVTASLLPADPEPEETLP